MIYGYTYTDLGYLNFRAETEIQEYTRLYIILEQDKEFDSSGNREIRSRISDNATTTNQIQNDQM